MATENDSKFFPLFIVECLVEGINYMGNIALWEEYSKNINLHQGLLKMHFEIRFNYNFKGNQFSTVWY